MMNVFKNFVLFSSSNNAFTAKNVNTMLIAEQNAANGVNNLDILALIKYNIPITSATITGILAAVIDVSMVINDFLLFLFIANTIIDIIIIPIIGAIIAFTNVKKCFVKLYAKKLSTE